MLPGYPSQIFFTTKRSPFVKITDVYQVQILHTDSIHDAFCKKFDIFSPARRLPATRGKNGTTWQHRTSGTKAAIIAMESRRPPSRRLRLELHKRHTLYHTPVALSHSRVCASQKSEESQWQRRSRARRPVEITIPGGAETKYAAPQPQMKSNGFFFSLLPLGPCCLFHGRGEVCYPGGITRRARRQGLVCTLKAVDSRSKAH